MGIMTHRFDDRLLWQALGASLVLHLLVALILPVWAPSQSEEMQPAETISFARLLHVEVQRPAAAMLPVAAPDAKVIARKVTFAHTRAELAVHRPIASARPLTANGPLGNTVAAAPHRTVVHAPVPPLAQPRATSLPVASVQSSSSRTPSPDVTAGDVASSQTGKTDRGGVMPFGERQDPVLDPGVLAQLQKVVHTAVTLTIVVGDDGKTKSVAFSPPLDAATQHTVESLLAEANWDAAVCGGGVSCEGTAVIRL